MILINVSDQIEILQYGILFIIIKTITHQVKICFRK